MPTHGQMVKTHFQSIQTPRLGFSSQIQDNLWSDWKIMPLLNIYLLRSLDSVINSHLFCQLNNQPTPADIVHWLHRMSGKFEALSSVQIFYWIN